MDGDFMFKMTNRYGNAVCMATTERERDELITKGYHEEIEKEEINLDKMTVDQLKAFATEKGISLEGCNNKAEILAKIKESIQE